MKIERMMYAKSPTLPITRAMMYAIFAFLKSSAWTSLLISVLQITILFFSFVLDFYGCKILLIRKFHFVFIFCWYLLLWDFIFYLGAEKCWGVAVKRGLHAKVFCVLMRILMRMRLQGAKPRLPVVTKHIYLL